MKILKNVKALSPVVASIILIAVTVAVSLAVAIWMGSLATPQAEQLNIIDIRFDKTGGKVYIDVSNTGSITVTISDIRIDDISYKDFKSAGGTLSDTLPYDLAKGTTHTFTITFTTWNFTSGVPYNFKILTAKGNIFGPKQAIPP
ncbi:MAG: archaellin/type IV pilin N-terminal domain-containing protein [Candidatus Bathyarchaeia archaeon]